MDQPPLFVESVHEALKEAVRALGGAKKVGHLLWPQKDVDDAARFLSDSLNADRKEKLDIEQVLLILKRAKEANYHGAMEFIASETGYARPIPVDPLDERAQLQRDFIAAAESVKRIAAKLERTEPSGLRAA